MSELRAWLSLELKASEDALTNAEALVEMSTASERTFRMAEWRSAKADARVARQLWATLEG